MIKMQHHCLSVNELQPGDIEIIAALGDSTIGATGENNIQESV